MATFKCKMCGGELDVQNKETVIECEYCGTKQTLPRLDDERRANLFDRANHFRRNNEFDKAEGIYEQILNEDTTDAEAYWSLVLCRYGIEYVEDTSTRKRVPTVNRAQFTSIFDDNNYKSAIQYADVYQRSVYEEEADAINEIQKGILAISQNEEPFDVFICYKETDQNGRRTHDSVLANDLYHLLTQEGFKVFFARITLEDKLGSAYEPYIFAALNSAKVMVVLGTRSEYFNAVWVKNEWSRYLSLVKQSGGKKMLIPAYKDMDPYDLPYEFSHLQAQDMSKLGFMQDLIRGIKKILKTDEQKPSTKETGAIENGTIVAPLLKRVFIFLEDGKWKEADEYCEKVLDQNPENAQAYLGKLMAELHLYHESDLVNCTKPFDKNNSFQKAMRYGDESFRQRINNYIQEIETRKLEKSYQAILKRIEIANKEEDYVQLISDLKVAINYKDSQSLLEKCQKEYCDLCDKRIKAMIEETLEEGEYQKFLEMLDSLGDYQGALQLKEKYKNYWSELKKTAYQIWNDYLTIDKKLKTEIAELEQKNEEIKSKRDVVATSIKKSKDLLKDLMEKKKRLAFLENELIEYEKEGSQIAEELSRLGFFSFSLRKKNSDRLKTIKNQTALDNKELQCIKEFIINSDNEHQLNEEIQEKEKELAFYEKDLQCIEQDLQNLEQEIFDIMQKLKNRQIILILAQDENIVAPLFDDYSIVQFVKLDKELCSKLIGYPSMPESSRLMLSKNLYSKSELDRESLYFQACQAVEYAQNMGDILWAYEQFLSLQNYKDSLSYLKKCKEMINMKTYKN